MANTYANLVTDAFAALNVVSRELVGFIPSVLRDSSADAVPVGTSLRVSAAPVAADAINLTPAMADPTAVDQTFTNVAFTITKAKGRPFSWNAEDQRNVDTGAGYLTMRQNQIAEAIRAMVNEMETDAATAAYLASSRAYGTAGTSPFGSSVGDSAQLKKILDDNGAPQSDRHLILSTSAGANLRTLAQLTKVNEAGSSDPIRRGVLLDMHGFSIRESAQVVDHTKGAGTGALINGTPAVGATTIPFDTLTVNTTGIKAGDVITIAGDTNKYVVTTGTTSTSGNLVIAAPGLKKAPADNAAITVGDSYSANVGFSRSSILLGTRLPEIPAEGDKATMRETITDPVSGLSFELACYPGFRMNTFILGAAWGVKVINPKHVATLLG